MIRWLLIIALAFGVYLFIASLGSGMGYASGGGEVRVFSSWSEAHSESGQAIAVYGDVENLNAANTPTPATKPPSRLEAFAPMAGLLLIALIAIVFFFFRFMPYMTDTDEEVSENGTKNTAARSRSYGPE